MWSNPVVADFCRLLTHLVVSTWRPAGKGLDLVRLFYSLLPQRHRWVEAQAQAAEFVIDETFGVPGVGTVVAGRDACLVWHVHTTLMQGHVCSPAAAFRLNPTTQLVRVILLVGSMARLANQDYL